MNGNERGTGPTGLVALQVWLVLAAPIVAGVAFVPGVVAGADAAGSVEGTPHFTASASNARLDPGQSGTIGVEVTNNATSDFGEDNPPEGAIDRAGEAQSVSVNISDTNVSGEEAAPLSVETGPQNAGTVQDGETSGPHSFDVVVDEDARAGTYQLNVTTEYTHYQTVNYTQDSDGDYAYTPKNRTTRTETDTITVVVEAQADFDVADRTNGVPLGGEGTLALDINHTGDENVTDATVTLRSQDSDFYFGSGTATSEAHVGTWEAGESHHLEFRAGTVESAVDREYPIDVTVDYTDSDDQTASQSFQIGVNPGQRDHFEVEGIDHTVPENGEGILEITAQQTWKHELTDVTVTASTEASDLYLGSEGSRRATTFVEEWWDGDYIRDLEFRVGTEDAALDREYPIDLEFEYTDEEDNQNTQTQTVYFTPTQRSFFEVEDLSHDVPRDGVGTLAVELEHLGEEDFEDVEVTASTSDSAVYLGSEGSTSATRMVGDWRDGHDETVTFRVGTTASAAREPYPLDLSIAYTDEDDNQNSRSKTVEFTPGAGGHLSIENVSHDVPRDGVGPVRVVLQNTADKPLTDLTATAATSDSEIYLGSESSRSGAATVERLEPGENRTITYQVGATENAVNRSYPLDLSMEYTDPAENENEQTEQVEFRPGPEPQFRVLSVDHDVPVGSTGQVALTVRNDGPVDASEAVLTATAQSDAMFLSTGGTEPVEVQGATFEPPQRGTPTAQTYLGNWSVGENRTVYLRAGFDEDAIVRPYVTELAFDFENQAGTSMPQRTRSVGIEPLPEQEFAAEPIESELYVGEEGDLRVEVTNAVDRPVEGVVLEAETQVQAIDFYNARYALGDLDPGESRTARFRVSVTGEAEPGPKVFEISGRYRDPGNEIRDTKSQDVLVDVGQDRDAFAVSPVENEYTPGGSGPLELRIRNQRNETLRNVQARLFTDDPLDSEDDSAFVERLEPGDTATVVFDVGVGGGAQPKTYSAALDFRFDNARGDSELSDTQRVPVTVREDGSMLGPVLAVLALLLAVGGILAYRYERWPRLRTAVDRIRR